MDSRVKNVRVPGSLLIIALLIAGCAADEKVADPAPTAMSHPDFFVANQWVDEDRSGGADYWEFEGANKWTFRSDEQISFVSRIEAPIGSSITWVLHAPDGETFDQGDSRQNWESTWRRAYVGPVIDLLDQGDPGVWWCDWFVNGQRVGECAANLMP